MKYKGSCYNYKVVLDDENLLFMNMRTQSKLKILKERSSEINKLVDTQAAVEIDDNYYSKLIEGGFLVPETVDEAKLLEMKNNEVIYGDNTLNVEILPTCDCNFRCAYCFEKTDDYKMSLETEERVIKFFEREIPHSKQLRLSWFGGEPLLCAEQVIRISQTVNTLCKKYKVPVYGVMSTNGYCLEVPVFRELIKNRITEFQVCLDGPEQFHNTTRPHFRNEDSYEKVINNLIDIKSQVQSSAFKIGIRCNITPAVLPYMEKHIEELSKYFKDDRRFYLIFQCVRDWGGERVHEEQIVKSEQVIYEKMYRLAREYGMYSADLLSFAPIIGKCEAGRKRGYLIDPRGNVHKCSLAMFDKDTMDVNQIGLIDKDGKAIINESKLANWLIEPEMQSAKCKKCFLFPFCMGGYCPYSKNILKSGKCNLYLTSMLKEHLLSFDRNNQIEIWNGGEV